MRTLFLFIAFGLTIVSAQAHAFLDHAEPRVGATATCCDAPKVVRLWFTEALEPVFSHVSVTRANGTEVDRRDVHVDAKDGRILTVSIPMLTPGIYTVKWQVVSKDTHRTQGTYTFTIQECAVN